MEKDLLIFESCAFANFCVRLRSRFSLSKMICTIDRHSAMNEVPAGGIGTLEGHANEGHRK